MVQVVVDWGTQSCYTLCPKRNSPMSTPHASTKDVPPADNAAVEVVKQEEEEVTNGKPGKQEVVDGNEDDMDTSEDSSKHEKRPVRRVQFYDFQVLTFTFLRNFRFENERACILADS